MSRPTPNEFDDYLYHHPIQTRWADNDIYGHINNSAYYFYFDTVVNHYLVRNCGLDIHNGDIIGLVVRTSCDYFSPAAFPEAITAGLRVSKLGTSSVTYELALFTDKPTAIAQGHFVHVYVDEKTRRPVPIDDEMRKQLQTLCSPT